MSRQGRSCVSTYTFTCACVPVYCVPKHRRIKTSIITHAMDEKCSYLQKTQRIPLGFHLLKTSNSSLKTRGAAAPRTRITCTSFLGLEEPSLKLLRSSELQRTNSSPISNCRRSKSAIFISRNINYNINSLLRLRVGIRIIYIYIYIYWTSVTYRKSK